MISGEGGRQDQTSQTWFQPPPADSGNRVSAFLQDSQFWTGLVRFRK